MDRCVLLTSTPELITRRGETTHSGVDVNNTHLSMINPLIQNYLLLMDPWYPQAVILMGPRVLGMTFPSLMFLIFGNFKMHPEDACSS